MTTEEIIKDVVDYSENTILFRPNLTPQGLGAPIQLQRSLKIDISNNKPTDDNSYKLYEINDIGQATEVIARVYQKPENEVRSEVDSFLKKHNVDLSKQLYMIVYLVEATNQDVD